MVGEGQKKIVLTVGVKNIVAVVAAAKTEQILLILLL